MNTQRWGDKPYHSLDYFCKQTFGCKLYKLSLDGGMTCPNRDGTLGTGGCIFCSQGGSGDFSVPADSSVSVTEQLGRAKTLVAGKMKEGRYIAYFQSYTNTYAPLPTLERLFGEAISHPDVAALSVATRPDCLPDETVRLLAGLNQSKPVWVELGLQTIHESTARFIRRGYELPCFLDSFCRLKEAGLTVVVHVILGLPGESREQMLQTVRYLGQLPVDGIKLQLLHILKDTELWRIYEAHPFHVLTLDEYVSLVGDCIAILPPSVVIHRISGDGPKQLLAAPLWSGNKRLVLNSISKHLREKGIYQGMASEITRPLPLSMVTPKDNPSM